MWVHDVDVPLVRLHDAAEDIADIGSEVFEVREKLFIGNNFEAGCGGVASYVGMPERVIVIRDESSYIDLNVSRR